MVEVLSDRAEDLKLFLDARRASSGSAGSDGADTAYGSADELAVVSACVAPGDSTGDSRLELPSSKRIKRASHRAGPVANPDSLLSLPRTPRTTANPCFTRHAPPPPRSE